jgi:hypothetical protein
MMARSNNRKLIEREVTKVNNAMWETLKHTHIVEEREHSLKHDLDGNSNGDVFYTPPQGLS